MPPKVLVVEDNTDLADIYATWLSAEYDVVAAANGTEALEALDDDFDVVLLDRRMPDISGDEVLEHIEDEGYDCRVAMVTAVEPDFDVLEMGFDDYLTKPVTEEDLLSLVEKLLSRTDYDSKLQEYYALVSKRALLQAEKSADELADSDEYARLESDIEALSEEVDAATEDFDEDDFTSVFHQV